MRTYSPTLTQSLLNSTLVDNKYSFFTLPKRYVSFSVLVPMTYVLFFLREILGVPSSAS